MRFLALGLSRLRVRSIDGLLPGFQCHHHGRGPGPIDLPDQVLELCFQLLPVD